MRRKHKISLFLLMLSVSVYGNGKGVNDKASVATDSTRLFFYSPGHKSGFHVACASNGQYKNLGQLFTSDYAQWGTEKRMYSPFITVLPGGKGYAAVFQVNDYSPCFAVAYSEDLITWRPQDYPRMSAGGCFAPVIRVDGAGRYTVLFKTKDGKVRQTTTNGDFRHFAADDTALESDYNKINMSRDTVEVDGKKFIGNVYSVAQAQADKLKKYFSELERDRKRNGETLAGDMRLLDAWGRNTVEATLKIEQEHQKTISDKLIGIFFEDISHAADGGLYAELVQNRDFEYTSLDRAGWTATTAWRSSGGDIVISEDLPLSKNNPHYAVLSADTLYNIGWDGISVSKGAKYDFSFYVNNIGGKGKTFKVALVSGGTVIAEADITTRRDGQSWKRYEATLVAKADAEKAELMIVPKGKEAAGVDMISLFPQDTFKGRKNGLRKDLAQVLADLRPKFVRFPGGCMSHGDGIENIYHWWHSVGPLQERVPDRNLWKYHQTRGLGFFEYFQFCEDIGAEPLPVLAAGVPCQNSKPDKAGYGGQQGGIPMEDMPGYVQEFLDLIEWANGDPATSKWARMRAEAGHPEPFRLKYIGIGNEDIISTAFEERFLMISKAIKELYPDIVVCGTVGPFHSPSSDYVEGWKFAKANRKLIDMVDEHYYESVGWFLNNQHYYDSYDRNGPKVYLGEYVAKVGKGGLDCALAEAVHLCNIERNADVVMMTSYAPLLSKNGHSNWSPDLIYFSNTGIQKTPSYETQRLFSVYSGDKYISSELSVDSVLAHRIAASVVRDSETGKTYLKVVNVLPMELHLTLSTGGLNVKNVLGYEGFSGKPGQRSVEVETGKYSVAQDTALVLKFPPYSFRVIEL